jgi:hypothetical protein
MASRFREWATRPPTPTTRKHVLMGLGGLGAVILAVTVAVGVQRQSVLDAILTLIICGCVTVVLGLIFGVVALWLGAFDRAGK